MHGNKVISTRDVGVCDTRIVCVCVRACVYTCTYTQAQMCLARKQMRLKKKSRVANVNARTHARLVISVQSFDFSLFSVTNAFAAIFYDSVAIEFRLPDQFQSDIQSNTSIIVNLLKILKN